MCSRTEMYTEAETLLSCSNFFQYSFMCTTEQKYNMHNFVCSLQRPIVHVITIIIATSSVIGFCLIAAIIHITVKATPCTCLKVTTISMADSSVHIFDCFFVVFKVKQVNQVSKFYNVQIIVCYNFISFIMSQCIHICLPFFCNFSYISASFFPSPTPSTLLPAHQLL